MFVQTQLHLFFKIITISLWSMIIWGSVSFWEGLFVVTLTDTDIIRASWLDPDDEFCSGCRTLNVLQCHHKHSFSGLHSPGQSYFTNLWYDSWVQTFYKITTGLNCNFHLRPTFTQKALRTVACVAGVSGEGGRGASVGEKRGSSPQTPVFLPRSLPLPLPPLTPAAQAMRTAVAVYEFHVTRNCFWTCFLWKPVSFRVILLKIIHKHAGIFSSIIKLLFPGIILWLLAKRIFFSLLLCPICCCQRYLAVENAVWLSQRKILSVFVSEELVLWSQKKNRDLMNLS